jgi:hypothetical protein
VVRRLRFVAVVALAPLARDPALGQVRPCPAAANCAEVRIEAPSGVLDGGNMVPVAIHFRQGEDDGGPGGVDSVAALALSLSIPHLELADCTDPDSLGLTPAVVVAEAFESFWVSIENTTCTRRDGCLCPGDGQGRDAFVNVAVTGARDLGPSGGLPALPSAQILTLMLRVSEDAPAGRFPLHVFAESDDPEVTPLPPFAALLSLGDTRAEEIRSDPSTGFSRVRIADAEIETSGRRGTPTHTPTLTMMSTPTATATAPGEPSPTPTLAAGACTGDCGGDGSVTVDELVRGVAMALGAPTQDCPAFHCGSEAVTVSCLVRAVNAALRGCL